LRFEFFSTIGLVNIAAQLVCEAGCIFFSCELDPRTQTQTTTASYRFCSSLRYFPQYLVGYSAEAMRNPIIFERNSSQATFFIQVWYSFVFSALRGWSSIPIRKARLSIPEQVR